MRASDKLSLTVVRFDLQGGFNDARSGVQYIELLGGLKCSESIQVEATYIGEASCVMTWFGARL
jgi:hypothetical protein